MFFFVNLLGLVVFLGIGVLASRNRKEIQWRSVASLLTLNLVLAWFLTSFQIGRDMITAAASGFTELINISYVGIAFVFPDWVNVPQMNFFAAGLLPILFVVPLFDILTYFGILPFIICWVGKLLTFLTRAPKFESFFAIEMMFLGNTEALAVSKLQLMRMSKERVLTIGLMSMSCVTAALIAVYVKMMPAEYVVTAIPLNVINALLVSSILHPVKVAPEEDTIATLSEGGEREPFFSYLAESILGAGRLVLIICANVIAIVALLKCVNVLLGLLHASLSLELILGVVLFPFAWLLGLAPAEAFQIAQYMGTKLITNEFVVMLQIQEMVPTWPVHMQAVMTVFITSFANLGTVGIILGCFKGLVDPERNMIVASNVVYMMLSGLLVSLLSAAICGLFVWEAGTLGAAVRNQCAAAFFH